ncbi:MFS transporter [Shewanella sp. 202IG2-18]|uniref:MFS transporter n=1 Tax=Parashewanella hymeniacidonis TaxID=2807618 RepID=UPI001960DEF5|nr:MFS transporter [Parashewanella hymeniacidonis]MBM7070639.1 MFS transporter [Parashewanella hymeniacidonis]
MDMERDHRHHFSLLNMGHLLTHYLVLIFPTVALFLVKPWQMSYPQLLKLGSFGALMYGVGVLPSGWLADRLGRAKVMAIFFFGSALACVMAGVSQSPFSLMVSTGFIGLFSAIYHPVGLSIIYGLSKKSGRLLAINGVYGNFGLAIAAVCSSFFATQFGWRWAFIIPGVVCFIIGLFYLKGFKAYTNSNSLGKQNMPEPEPVNMKAIFSCILVIAACGGLAFNSLTTGLPKILSVEDTLKAYSLVQIGGIATTVLFVASLAQLVVGELLHRFQAEKLLFTIVAIQAITFGIMAVFQVSLVVLGISVFFIMAQLPINDFIIGKHAHDKWRSLFYALKYTLSLGSATAAYWLLASTYNPVSHFKVLFGLLFFFTVASVMAGLSMVLIKEKSFNQAVSTVN